MQRLRCNGRRSLESRDADITRLKSNLSFPRREPCELKPFPKGVILTNVATVANVANVECTETEDEGDDEDTEPHGEARLTDHSYLAISSFREISPSITLLLPRPHPCN